MLSPNARAPKERIFSTAVGPKKEKKGLLDNYLINGPSIKVDKRLANVLQRIAPLSDIVDMTGVAPKIHQRLL